MVWHLAVLLKNISSRLFDENRRDLTTDLADPTVWICYQDFARKRYEIR